MGNLENNQHSALPRNVHFELALLPSGWARNVCLSVQDGLITHIESGAVEIDKSGAGKVALPGLSNLHSHAFQRGMSGLTEFRRSNRDSFWSWRDLLYKFVETGDPDDIEAITAMAFCEMLEGGFTRVAEFHYLHHGADGAPFDDPAEMSARIVSAARDTGIGLTLLPVFYAHSDFGGAPPTDGQRRFINSVEGFSDIVGRASAHCVALPDAVVGIAPHSLRATTAGELAELCTNHPAGPIHIHISEQMKEVEASLAWSGARPVEWLLSNADVDARWCLVHATHTTPAERLGIAQSRAVVGLCPITEANLGDGTFEISDFLEAGGRFGVGSDSNVSISASDELRMLEYSQRLNLRKRNVVATEGSASTGRALFSHAKAGGDQACGVSSELAPGRPADFVVLDVPEHSLASASPDGILDQWIFGTRACRVTEVWRRGSCVVRGGNHIDRNRIEGRFVKALERILR